MKKIQDLAKIIGVEIDDTLKDINRHKDIRGNWRTLVRLVVSFYIENSLNDQQTMLLSKLTSEQRAFMRRTNRSHKTINVSNLFNASDILPEPFDTPENGFSDEQQDAIVARVKEYLKSIGNISIFTVHTFNLFELCNYDVLYDCKTGKEIHERSYLSSGFNDDDEKVKNILSNYLQELIDNGEVTEVNTYNLGIAHGLDKDKHNDESESIIG